MVEEEGELITDQKLPSVEIDPRLVSLTWRKSKLQRRGRERKAEGLLGPRLLSESESEHETMNENYVYKSYRRRIRKSTDIPKETHRLSLYDMDWSRISAKDLLLLLIPYLLENGRILSVVVYPSEFRIQRTEEEEEIYGPMEDDEDYIRRDYHAVVECDSIATAKYLFKSCDGIEFEIERSLKKFDFGFIPNSIKFKHRPCDIANEECV